MKKISKVLFSLVVFASMFTGGLAMANEQAQVIYRGAEQKAYQGPAQYFTGEAWVQPLFPDNQIATYVGAYVTFAPGARSNWHTHTAGQHLIVTKGVCWTQTWNGQKSEAHPGDTIWCPPGVKHWHGASPDGEMTHLSLAHMKDGENTVWLERVTDEQYYSK